MPQDQSDDQNALPVDKRLTPEALRRLAALVGASKPAIEAAIALAPFAFRVQLYSHIPSLIATEPDEAAAIQGRPTKIELTQAGRRVIAECATWVEAHPESPVPTLVSSMYV